MIILRLSTFSLIMAIAVITIALPATPALANPADAKGCHTHKECDSGGDPGGLTYTIDLIGPYPANPSIRGAFEFDDAARSATLDRGALKITGAVTMKRPSIVDCVNGNEDQRAACTVWNDVFNLCGLLGPWNGMDADDGSTPTNLYTFTVLSGDWSVNQGGGRRWIGFEFTIAPSFSSDEIDRDLSASLQLTSPCLVDPVNNPSCENDPPLIPASGETTETLLQEARIHLRGKGGVTHKADCHADNDSLSTSFSTLVITAD